jgi:hypothetical protein
MKKYILPLVLVLSIFSCKTVELTDGTRITKRQERKIYEKVFNDTFGQMTEEEVQLFEGVNFQVDTSSVETSERVIDVYIDTSYVVEPSLIIYKELIPSVGDTSITYVDDLIIVDGVRYISLEETTWVDYRICIVYR